MVAGERRRPAASSTGETVMGSPPNRTADTEPAALPALTHPRRRHHLKIPLSLRLGEAKAGGSSARHPALVRSERLAGTAGDARVRGTAGGAPSGDDAVRRCVRAYRATDKTSLSNSAGRNTSRRV